MVDFHSIIWNYTPQTELLADAAVRTSNTELQFCLATHSSCGVEFSGPYKAKALNKKIILGPSNLLGLILEGWRKKKLFLNRQEGRQQRSRTERPRGSAVRMILMKTLA
jgi:hypothetical protein